MIFYFGKACKKAVAIVSSAGHESLYIFQGDLLTYNLFSNVFEMIE